MGWELCCPSLHLDSQPQFPICNVDIIQDECKDSKKYGVLKTQTNGIYIMQKVTVIQNKSGCNIFLKNQYIIVAELKRHTYSQI